MIYLIYVLLADNHGQLLKNCQQCHPTTRLVPTPINVGIPNFVLIRNLRISSKWKMRGQKENEHSKGNNWMILLRRSLVNSV